MAQLGRFLHTVLDSSGNAVNGVSVTVNREGATVNDAQAITSGQSINVHNNGKIVNGDSVFVNTTTGTTYTAGSVTDTTMTLSGFGGTLSLNDLDRLVPSGTTASLFKDDHGVDADSNPLTSSATGIASAWCEAGAYDVVTSGGGTTTTLFSGIVVDSEAWGGIRYADSFARGSSTGGIQEALDDLPSGGGVVVLSPTTYSPTAAISIPSKSTIRGAGAGISIVQQPNSTDLTNMFVNSDTTNGNTNITLRDFTIDGNKANNTSTNTIGVSITAGSDYRIQNCEIKNNRSFAIFLNSSSGAALQRVWIEDNHIHDGAPTGIADESISIDNHSSQPTEYVYILNNHFETGIGGQFIVIPGSVLDTNQARRILIRGNTMENNATAAMQLQYCRDVVVCGNQISNCVTGGIMVFGAATFAGGPNNITICCNVIDQPNETSGNGGDGNGIEVPAGGGGSVTVSNNTITRVRHTGKFGISAGTGKSISVTGNSILNSDGGGINLTANTVATDEGPFICTGNIIRTCTGTTGILATTDIAGCVISNNSITDATNAASRGIFVTNLNSAALTDLVVNGNNIENTGTRSIYIQTQATGSAQAARISVCNNNCRDSGEIGIVIGNYDDSTVSGNVVTSAVSHGIRVDGGTNLNNIFSGNVCMDNGGSGISLAGTNNQVNINNNMSCDNTTDGITIAAATAGTMVCNTVLGNGSAQINGSITGGETANNDIA